jgi:hypothetical protein
MAVQTNDSPTITATPGATACDTATRVTKSLLGYGVIAGPLYVLVSLAQALTREGFDLSRHEWSLLSNGSLGWIQITNFLVTGLMTIAFAVGVRRVLPTGSGTTWAPRLIATYGVGLIAAGVFRADPALGFPTGAPAGQAQVSWHGALHFLSAGIGFSCLVAATLVIAARLAAEGRRGWARYTRVSGVVFLAGFVAAAAGANASWGTLSFVAGVLVIFTWISAMALHLYRRAAV